MQIRPLMQNLPKLVDNYNTVCGENNPFEYPALNDLYTQLNITPGNLHGYLQVFNGDLPVMNDYQKLYMQIVMTINTNAPKYIAMHTVLAAAAAIDPTSEMHYTDTMVRTGHDDLNKTGTETNTRTGNVADSGTDSTTNGGTVTDSVKTYESSAYKETGKSVSSGTGSITHGKTTTYNQLADARTFAGRKDETTYGSTFTRTVSGYKSNPMVIMQQYADFVLDNNVFMEIIHDVVRAISCIVYIPVIPENTEEE